MSNEKLLINNPKSNNSEDMRNKRVEEMSQVVRDTIYRENENGFAEGFDALCTATEYLTEKITEALYNAGYRKQIVGEWLVPASGKPWNGNTFGLCSRCGKTDNGFIKKAHKYCPNCGAKMKGA